MPGERILQTMSGDATGDERADAELVAATLQAVANPHRLELLRGLYQGRARTDLVAQLPISESGVSNHLRTLADAGLVYRTEEGWTLSPLGAFFARFLELHSDVVADARQQIKAARAEAEEEYTDVPLPEQEREGTIEWRTWNLVRDELEDLLADRPDGFDDASKGAEDSGE